MKNLKNQNGLSLLNSNTERQKSKSKLFPAKVFQQVIKVRVNTEDLWDVSYKKRNRVFNTCEQIFIRENISWISNK